MGGDRPQVRRADGLAYEPVGGINPKDGPVALCVGGTNRLTGQLVEGFWGSSCDADEKEVGGLFGKAVLPTAILAKAHMPDLAKVVPAFNVESIEGTEVRHPALRPQGGIRVDRLQQALHRDGAEGVRPGRAARAVQPRLPRAGRRR